MAEQNVAQTWHGVFFTKQPVLDIKRSIWGYELLGGEIREGICEIFPQKESTAGLTPSSYLVLQEAMERGKKIMVGFDDAAILIGIPYVLPPASGVVRVLPSAVRTPELSAALQALRNEGYQTVVEFHPGEAASAELCEQADIVSLDLSAGVPDPVSIERMQKCGCPMLARGVKTRDQFQAAKDMGFSLFQGSFLREPEWLRDRQLGSNEVARLNLLRLIEMEDPDVKALAAAIRSDVSISFRLLSYLNSAWFGLRHNVESIDQAS